MRIIIFVLALFAVFIGSPRDSTAQQGGSPSTAANEPSSDFLTGWWYGVIDEYAYGEPGRVLNVTVQGGIPSCKWSIVGTNADHPARSCSVRSNTLHLTTTGDSVVVLNHTSSDLLQGTFTLKNGKVFPINMGRDRQVLVVSRRTPESLAPFVGEWRGTRYVKCSFNDSARLRTYKITIRPSGEKVSLYYSATDNGCFEWPGVNWNTTATFKEGGLVFLGNTKYFELSKVGDNLTFTSYRRSGSTGKGPQVEQVILTK